MTKINRRDYLIGMGATAGVLATGQLNLRAHGQLATVSPAASAANALDVPPTESVKLVFHGLMGIAVESNQAVIGFHSRPSQKHRHNLKVMAFRNEGTQCRIELHETAIPLHAMPVLDVVLPDLFPEVRFYQPPSVNGGLHPNDFRHVIDLEGSKWYDRRLRPWTDAYKPRMNVKSGLFYTLMKTNALFRRQTEGETPSSSNVRPIGSVAEYIAANIYLQSRGRVTLKIPETSPPVNLTLEQAPNVKYEVHFNNDCSKVGQGACEFRPFDSDHTERNDFYMHRHAVNLGNGPIYQLVLALPAETTSNPSICSRPHPAHQERKLRRMTTDEAPCAPLGYGSPSWPRYPES